LTIEPGFVYERFIKSKLSPNKSFTVGQWVVRSIFIYYSGSISLMHCGPSYVKYNKDSNIVGGKTNEYCYPASLCSTFSTVIYSDLKEIVEAIIEPEEHCVWNLLGVDTIISDEGIFIIDINNHPGVKGLVSLDLPLDILYSNFIDSLLNDEHMGSM
jgi:hypothetical protein